MALFVIRYQNALCCDLANVLSLSAHEMMILSPEAASKLLELKVLTTVYGKQWDGHPCSSSKIEFDVDQRFCYWRSCSECSRNKNERKAVGSFILDLTE